MASANSEIIDKRSFARTCLVSVARNRYSVPCELFGQMVSTRLYPGSVLVVAGDEVVARHDRLSNAGETRYDWQHYIPLLQIVATHGIRAGQEVFIDYSAGARWPIVQADREIDTHDSSTFG